jgi:hypothetical protein
MFQKRYIFKSVGKVLALVNPLRWLGAVWLGLTNWLRGRRQVDYILLTLPAELSLVPEERAWWQRRVFGTPPLSLLELEREFRRIADDPRPKGVILHLRGLNLSLADLQTLRGSFQRLRARGKRVICFAQSPAPPMKLFCSRAGS